MHLVGGMGGHEWGICPLSRMTHWEALFFGLFYIKSIFGRPDHAHQVVAKFIGKFGDLHSLGDNNFAGKYRARLCIRLRCHGVSDPAILALLIPAIPAVGNSIGAYELEGTQADVVFGNLKGFSQNRSEER